MKKFPLEDNPFHELFFTDSAPTQDFVRYFSPFLVPHVRELFQQGNVVLKGTQGCGKTMLLTLLRPEIRVAYFEKKAELEKAGLTGRDFPVPEDCRNFIGAGVNLSKSGILDLAQLLPQEPSNDDFHHLTALFSDFLNYWLFKDLLDSLRFMTCHSNVFGNLVNPQRFGVFAERIRKQDCWFGHLMGCDSLDDLEKRVSRRILSYRSLNARNIQRLDETILRTKTAIGEPLSRTVECLKEAQVIARDVRVFLRIDQMEQLWHLIGDQAKLSSYFRKEINKVIGNRDLRVSYRIGTRRYAWSEDLALPGGRQIEELRDFVVVDLDKRLRRGEDRSAWLFQGFAADVFRLRVASQDRNAPVDLDIHSFFGRSPTPHELVERSIVSPPDDPQKLLKLDQKWSTEWREYIRQVYEKQLDRPRSKVSGNYPKNPLDALLIAAWGLQTGGVTGAPERRSKPPPKTFPPWTVWWEKERLMVAVMVLVVRHRQKLFWWGLEKVLALAASNITLFLSISRDVWDQWQRRSREERIKALAVQGATSEPVAPWKTQALAIDAASHGWHRNFARQPGRPAGDVRMRFLNEVGSWLQRRLLSDEKMSYPGGNGFSLRQSDLLQHKPLARLLEEAVGWGDLYEVEHPTKLSSEKHRDPRKKYYLNPILSPYFQIPEAHTKEPLCEPVGKIIRLAVRAKALVDSST